MVDLGYWTRMPSLKQAGLADYVGVYASTADISGSRFDPHSAGMQTTKAMLAQQQRTRQPVQVPHISNSSLSVNDPHELRLLDAAGYELAGSRFSDTHPEEWTTKLANDGQVIFLVGPVPPHEAPTFMEFLSEAYIGVLSVAVYQYPTGVGVVGPSQAGPTR